MILRWETQTGRRELRVPFRVVAGLCLLLCLFLNSTPIGATAKITVNPVGEWIPIIARFELNETEATGSGGGPGPFATKIKTRAPSIPSAWRELEEMVRIRSAPRPTDPVISGWRPWYTPEGASGIEVKAADPGTSPSVISFARGSDRKVAWEVQIWGRYRLKDPDDPEKKRVLRPADPKFQKLIKQKIEVVDFSLTAHKVQPGGTERSLRNPALETPYQTLGTHQSGVGGAHRSLAFYEAQEYLVRMRSGFVGELRLQMRLRFPEAEKAQASGYFVPLETSMRFASVDWTKPPRVISDKLKKIDSTPTK